MNMSKSENLKGFLEDFMFYKFLVITGNGADIPELWNFLVEYNQDKNTT